MNTQSLQKVLLASAAAALLSGSRALAQNQAAAAAVANQQVVGMAPAVAGAVARSASNVANPDQLEASPAKARSLAPRIRQVADYEQEKPEDIHFSFVPPPTTRRKGHPEDRDIKLADKQVARLNEIGEALVDFVDSRFRVETNETAMVNAMNSERDKDVEACAKAFTEAQRKREKAQSAVLDAAEKLKVAKLEQEEKQADFDAKQAELNALNEKIAEEINNIDKLNDSIRNLEIEQSQAEEDKLTAAARLQKGEEEAGNLDTALKVAQGQFREATNSLAKAEADAKATGEAIKEARGVVEKAKSDVESGEAALDAAEDARDDATKAVRGAEKDVAKATRALEKAGRTLEKAGADAGKADSVAAKAKEAKIAADAAAEAARAEVEEAAKAKEAAEAAVEAFKPENVVKPEPSDEKQGFWARWAARRAERRAVKQAKAPLLAERRRAATALRQAEADARHAAKFAKAAKDDLDEMTARAVEAHGALDSATKARDDAETALDGKKADLEKAKGVLDEKSGEFAAARKALEEAGKSLADARASLKDQEGKLRGLNGEISNFTKAAARAESAARDLGGKLDVARKEVESLSLVKKEAEEKAAALAKQIAAINATTDNTGRANLAHEWERIKLEKEAGTALDALEIAKGKVIEAEQLDTPEKRAALALAEKEEAEAKEAYVLALNKQNRVANDAKVAVQRAEKDLEARIENDRREFWDLFREEQRMSAADAPNAEKANADKELDAAKAALVEVGGKAEASAAALAAAKAASSSADKALADARGAVKDANRAVAAAERKASSASDAATKAAEALAAAEAAVKDAQDPEKAAAAVKVATERKTAADKAKGEADKAVADAGKARGDAEAALKSAEDAARKAKDELAKASIGKEESDGALKDAQNHLADATKAVSVVGKSVDGARAETDRAVDVLVRAFDEQVAATRLRKLAAINWWLIDQNTRERMAARKARREYFAAGKAYAAARRELAFQRRRFELKEIPWDAQEYVIARDEYSRCRTAFEVAEDVYNKYFSDSHTFQTASLTDAEADACYDTDEALKALHGVQFRGDRRWLARTSVNGEPLLDSFLGEMEWQADQVGRHDAEDPSKVSLTPEQAVECARVAAATVQRRAVYGGFYFAGLDVELKDGVPVCFVDKGRYGPISVLFVDEEGHSLDTGRIYNETNILAKLGSKAGDTNALNAVREGEAFNFIEFRKNFNALNANPDIAKADAAFKPVDDIHFSYGFEDEDEGMGTNRTTRVVAADIKVREEPWPAPLHGVLAIDNFNSMGAADEMGVQDPDAWMARLTLQRLDLWDLGHALTLSGNYSIGGSLYGGAASYYIPREEGAWDDGAWRRLSGWSWTFHGGYTEVDQDLHLTGGTLGILGTGYYGGWQASSRLVDFNESSLDISLGFTYRYVENSVRIERQEIPLGPGGDGYTIMPLSVALMYAENGLDDWRGRNFATLEGVFNLGGSSAEDLKAFRTAIDDDQYMILRAQFARLNLLWEDTDAFLVPRLLFLRADAQWASTALIGAEQYGLGGHGTVRGYVERQFMGDNGASGTVEFRTPIGLGYLDRKGDSAYTAADRLQLVYFGDIGYYMLQDAARSASGTLDDEDELLYSIGLGLRYSYRDFVLRVDWGVPLQRSDIEISSGGVGHVSVQYQF